MILIFAHHYDAEAKWLSQTLTADYNLPAVCILPEALGVDYSLSLHLQNNGKHYSTIFFEKSRRCIKSDNVWYAVNRLSYINPLMWKNADIAEKTYATNEINSFFPALIYSLKCPVSNKIHNGALYGDVRFASRWINYFQQIGVSVQSLVNDEAQYCPPISGNTSGEDFYRFIYFNNNLISPPLQKKLILYEHIKKNVLKTGESETLEFIFSKNDNRLELLQISKTPSLSLYGSRFTNEFFQIIKSLKHDYTNGHTQRNTVNAAR